VIVVFVCFVSAASVLFARHQGAHEILLAALMTLWLVLAHAAFHPHRQLASPRKLAIIVWENLYFASVGLLLLAPPMWWLKRAGGMPAALLCAAAIACWLLWSQRRFAFGAWVVTQTDTQRPWLRWRRDLLQLYWQDPHGATLAGSQFFTRGIWVNTLDALLVLVPLALLIAHYLALDFAHWNRVWAAFAILLGPALVAMRWILLERLPAKASTETPARRSRIDPELFELGDESFEQLPTDLSVHMQHATQSAQPSSAPAQLSACEALQAVLLQNDLDALQSLLDTGLNPNQEPPPEAGDQRLPLTIAAANGQVAFAKALIKSGAKINALRQGQSALLAATRDSLSGRFDMVQLLLTNGADVHARDGEQSSALHSAARSNDLAIVQRLLQAGADVHAVDQYGYTPLQRAVRAGQLANMQALHKAGSVVDAAGSIGSAHALARSDQASEAVRQWVFAKAELELRDRAGLTPLMVAAREGMTDLVDAFLAHGADATATDLPHGNTPLMLAALHGHAKTIACLAGHRVELDARNHVGDSALHQAVRAEQSALICVDALLKLNARADTLNHEGKTPEAIALTLGRWDLARRLNPNHSLSAALEQTLEDAGSEESGANIKRETLLIQCAHSNRLSAAQSLTALGATDRHTLVSMVLALGNRLTPDWLVTLRHLGLHVGAMEVDPISCALARLVPAPEKSLFYLLEAGCSIAADAEGDSALILLCGAATEHAGEIEHTPVSLELIQLLLERGADPNFSDSQGRHAISYAVDWCDCATLELLLRNEQSPAKLNERDQAGLTLLLRAVKRVDKDQLTRIRLLVRAGADTNLCGRDGQTPRALALNQADTELSELLSWSPASHPGRRLGDRDIADAGARGDWQSIERLLQLGFHVDGLDSNGISALTHACSRSDLVLIERLLQAGADVNGPEGAAFTPLAAAIRARHFDWIRRLHQLGASLHVTVDGTPNGVGYVALAAAALDQDCVTLLLELGAPIQIASMMPAVHATVRAVLAGGDLEGGRRLLQTLIQRGADPDDLDFNQRSALMLLVGANMSTPQFAENAISLALMDALLRLGANAQQRDVHQRAPLHWCCKHGLFDFAERLLEAGADPMAVDEFRKLPVDMATALNRHDFNALFRN
jgi:uncharacterized protein